MLINYVLVLLQSSLTLAEEQAHTYIDLGIFSRIADEAKHSPYLNFSDIGAKSDQTTTDQDERFGIYFRLPNVAVACRTQANCCRAQCMTTGHTCVAGMDITGMICLTGVTMSTGTVCRRTNQCGACNSFNCPNNGNTECNDATGRICPN